MNKKAYKKVQVEVINRIQKSLESGEKFHWIKPWNDTFIRARNYQSGNEYKGINMLLLSDGGEYLTYKQIQEINKKDSTVKLRKGASGKPIVFFQLKELKDENGNIVLDEDSNPKKYPIYKIYYVFSLQEIEGLETKAQIPRYEHNNEDIQRRCDKVIELFAQKTNLEIQTTRGANQAYYNPNAHVISLPDKSQFQSLYDYYHVVFHELTHSYLHNKNQSPTEYARGELEAEIGASALCNLLEIPFDGKPNNDVAYLQSWLKQIRSNKDSLLLTASSRAFKAADYIFNEEELKINLEADAKESKLKNIVKNQPEFKVTKITINKDERSA